MRHYYKALPLKDMADKMRVSCINPNGIHNSLSVDRDFIFRRNNIWRINDWMYSVKMS